MIRNKVFGAIIGLLAGGGLGIFFCGIYNQSVNDPVWVFSTWQTVWLVLVSLNGAALFYNFGNESRTLQLNKSFLILLAILFVRSGADIIQREEIFFNAVTFRGKYAIYWGILNVVLGILLIVAALFMKKNISYLTTHGKYVICSKCLEPAQRVEHKITCQKCGSTLEDIEGFYDRHPELKHRKQ